MTLRKRTSALVLTVAGAIAATLAVPGGGGAAAATSPDLRVGSFNISGVSFDSSVSGEELVWKQRRPKVVSQVLGQKLDALGVQEANVSAIYADRLTYGETQYTDLLGALKAKGGTYALTNTASYNCVNPRSTYKCVYQDRGSAGDNRILYNTATTTMVRQGGVTYSARTSGRPERFMAWAVLKQKSTGKQYFFANTHLDPYDIGVRLRQWDQLISSVNRLKGGLPVVVVGDFNTSKFSDYAGTYLPRMKNNGYGDVLNQTYRQPRSQPRAEALRRGWVNSFGNFNRDVTKWSYAGDRTKIGNSIDWVFASNNVRVKAWETVVDVDPTTLRLRGVIPSDHALVRSTLVLP